MAAAPRCPPHQPGLQGVQLHLGADLAGLEGGVGLNLITTAHSLAEAG
jgi:hypothetical protein